MEGRTTQEKINMIYSFGSSFNQVTALLFWLFHHFVLFKIVTMKLLTFEAIYYVHLH